MAASLSYTDGLKAVTLDRVRAATDRDQELVKLREALLSTEDRFRLPEGLEQYDRYRDRMSVLEGNVMYDRRVVIPEALQQEVVQGLHAAHQWVGGMLARAQQTVF